MHYFFSFGSTFTLWRAAIEMALSLSLSLIGWGRRRTYVALCVPLLPSDMYSTYWMIENQFLLRPHLSEKEKKETSSRPGVTCVVERIMLSIVIARLKDSAEQFSRLATYRTCRRLHASILEHNNWSRN
jgi:hypothetical protein